MITLPTYLYLKSNFLGWSLAKGGEPLFLGLFAGAFIYAFVNALSRSHKRRSLAYKSLSMLGLLAAGSLVPWINSPPFWAAPGPSESQQEASWSSQELQGRVAHAAGALKGVPYTNSIDALTENSKFYEVFEIDFLRTSDGKIVCVHDWPNYWKATGEEFFHAPDYEEFVERQKKMRFQPCDLESLGEWLQQNPNKKLILDSKSPDHVLIYGEISQAFPTMKGRIYPQIYNADEFAQVSSMGWAGVILSIYKHPAPASVLLSQVEGKDLAAIVVPDELVETHAPLLVEAGLNLFVHTINDFQRLKQLKNLGVNEIYTDVLRVN